GTQEYMAMEKLGQLLEDSTWDLVIVDTPPSRNALDFLDAPARLAGFMDSRLMRLLAAPGRGMSKIVAGTMSGALKMISQVVGSSMLRDASEFVQALDTTFGGFATRASRTQAILRRKGTEFVVIATAEAPALREAGFFVDRLSEEKMPLAGVVINRTHPRLVDLDAAECEAGAKRVAKNHPEAAAALRIHADRALTASAEVRLISGFTKQRPSIPVLGVPSLPFEVSNLRALRSLGDQLVGRE
uniref:ArsA family ATPase n=1 Tax=Dietzia sp. TaxID=1871616 RepID=UPI002FD971BE